MILGSAGTIAFDDNGHKIDTEIAKPNGAVLPGQTLTTGQVLTFMVVTPPKGWFGSNNVEVSVQPAF